MPYLVAVASWCEICQSPDGMSMTLRCRGFCSCACSRGPQLAASTIAFAFVAARTGVLPGPASDPTSRPDGFSASSATTGAAPGETTGSSTSSTGSPTSSSAETGSSTTGGSSSTGPSSSVGCSARLRTPPRARPPRRAAPLGVGLSRRQQPVLRLRRRSRVRRLPRLDHRDRVVLDDSPGSFYETLPGVTQQMITTTEATAPNLKRSRLPTAAFF